MVIILLFFHGIGHGGSDGLHGYVPSLDHVVADTVSSVIPFSLFFPRQLFFILSIHGAMVNCK
jgi:hypothetical protein